MEILEGKTIRGGRPGNKQKSANALRRGRSHATSRAGTKLCKRVSVYTNESLKPYFHVPRVSEFIQTTDEFISMCFDWLDFHYFCITTAFASHPLIVRSLRKSHLLFHQALTRMNCRLRRSSPRCSVRGGASQC